MLATDFEKHNIDNFTVQEVMDTGCSLGSVDVKTMISTQRFREYVRRRVKLIENGLTTGGHKAPWHPRGLAVDSYLLPEDGPINIHLIFKGALTAGFKGIGIYWNQILWSFHFDHRPDYAFWGGVKDEPRLIKEWQWYSILRDLRKIRL